MSVFCKWWSVACSRSSLPSSLERNFTIFLDLLGKLYVRVLSVQMFVKGVDLVFVYHRQGAVYKIKCCDCQAPYIGETGRNLNTRLTEHKRATRNGDLNNNIAEHHLQTNHRIDWDSAERLIYSTDYYQRLTLESWFTNLEQTPLNRCQQLPAPYKRLINHTKTDKQ